MAKIANSIGVVKTHNGIEIHATSEGRFSAVVNGVTITLASLSGLMKRIQGVARPVRGMEAGDRWYLWTPEERQIIDVTKNNQVRYIDPPANSWDKPVVRGEGVGSFFLYDEAAFKELAEIAAQYAKLKARREEIKRGLVRIDQATWPEIQAEMQAAEAEKPEQP